MTIRLLAMVLMMAVAATATFSSFAQPSPSSSAGDDAAAIRQSAANFADLFNKGNAKSIAAMYTENGESREPGGVTFTGRAAIEKAFAENFKANPGASIEVLVQSVRFPAKDLAVEEGLLRSMRSAKDLPITSSYVAIHVREGGAWKIALSSEAGAGLPRLEDLDWLAGEWNGKTKDSAVKFAFAKDAKKPWITGTFTKTPTGKESATGSIRIAFDPETKTIRSWGFEDDGAHSQALWHHDGKSWIIDCHGVLANGTPFSETIILQRTDKDAITWRATDRRLGDETLADTPPVKLTRK